MRKKRSQVTASKKSFITEDVIISTFGFIIIQISIIF